MVFQIKLISSPSFRVLCVACANINRCPPGFVDKILHRSVQMS